MTPHWLRTRAIVGNTIFHFPKPVRVYTQREVRSRHGVKVMRLILAAFYEREKDFARLTLAHLLENIPPLSYIEKEIRQKKNDTSRGLQSVQQNERAFNNIYNTPHRSRKRNISVPSPSSSRKSRKVADKIAKTQSQLKVNLEGSNRKHPTLDQSDLCVDFEESRNKGNILRDVEETQPLEETSITIVCAYGTRCLFKNNPKAQVEKNISRKCFNCRKSMHDLCAGESSETPYRRCPKCRL